MEHRSTHRIAGLVCAAVAVLVVAPVAGAHGLGAVDPNRPLLDYLWLGFKHLLEGWDHLLFILAIVLLAGSLWRATKLISLFVAGHSITLMLATTQEWRVSPTLVDVVIALSVVFVAVIGLRGRPKNWTWFGVALFGVGLVHGLGLATRLLDLGVSDNDLVWRVLLFNIGVEFGQAAAILAFAAAGAVLVRVWASRERVRRPAFGVIATAGAIGAAILSWSGDDASTTPVGAACKEAEAKPPTANEAGHPRRRFYNPGEQSPVASFMHIRGDGYVVVTYRPDMDDDDVDRLRKYIDAGPKFVYGGPAPDQTDPVVAITAFTQLTCAQVDVPALTTFHEGWLKQMGGKVG